MAQLVKNPPAMRKTWVRALGRGDPRGRGQPPTPALTDQCADKALRTVGSCASPPSLPWLLVLFKFIQLLPTVGQTHSVLSE